MPTRLYDVYTLAAFSFQRNNNNLEKVTSGGIIEMK